MPWSCSVPLKLPGLRSMLNSLTSDYHQDKLLQAGVMSGWFALSFPDFTTTIDSCSCVVNNLSCRENHWYTVTQNGLENYGSEVIVTIMMNYGFFM